MEIITELEGDEMRIELRGRLDAAWSNSVSKTLQDSVHGGSHRIALDLSQVSYLSSAGIRVLVILAKNLKAVGGSFRLINPSPSVSDVLRLVGFQQLLDTFNSSAAIQKPTLKEHKNSESRSVKIGENDFDIYTVNLDSVQQGLVIGDVENKLVADLKHVVAMPVNNDTWVIGQGVLGAADFTESSFGELLAVSGLAITLPGDDPAHPDWMQHEADLVPEVSLLHGLKGVGEFRYLMRFGEIPETAPIRLSDLAKAAMELCVSDMVSFVILAETAHLIGAAAQVSHKAYSDEFFDFPAIREHLLFTAEPAYADDTCLIVGLIARNPQRPLATQLRPMANDSDLFMHAHASVVPFIPVRKGFIDLSESLQKLMVTQTIRGVLHLLNDDREGIGAGESFLRRGALWCAPIDFKREKSE
jgi:anti-anti-sigma factor